MPWPLVILSSWIRESPPQRAAIAITEGVHLQVNETHTEKGKNSPEGHKRCQSGGNPKPQRTHKMTRRSNLKQASQTVLRDGVRRDTKRGDDHVYFPLRRESCSSGKRPRSVRARPRFDRPHSWRQSSLMERLCPCTDVLKSGKKPRKMPHEKCSALVLYNRIGDLR